MKKPFLLFITLLIGVILLLPVFAAETCPACGKTVTWETMPSSVPTAAGHYHYALSGDKTISQWQLKDGVTICLDLQGHTLRSSGRMFNLATGSELNILDSVGTGYAIATTGNNNVTGGVISIAENAKCSQYGGTLQLETKYVSGRGVGTGGIVYMNKTCTYNLFGGVVQGAELVKSEYTPALTYNGYGSAFYMAGGAQLNVYGGEIRSGSVPEGGKGQCIFLNSKNARVTVTGNAKLEEVYYNSDNDQFVVEGCYTGSATLAYNSTLNIQQGSVLGVCTDANLARATILCRDWMLIDQAGKLATIPNSEAAICGEETQYFPTVQQAVDSYESGYVKLLKNHLTIHSDKPITLDLNGQDATVSGNVTAFDSQTDDHDISDGIYGQLSGDAIAAESYVPVTEKGKTSFHRADLEITAMTLRPCVAGVYYQSRILCDEKAAAQVESYGVALNAFEAPSAQNMDTTTKASCFTKLSAGETFASGVLLKGIVKARNSEARNQANSQLPVYGSAYLRTIAGNYIFGKPVTRSLQQQLEAADTLWQQLDNNQKIALLDFYHTYEPICNTWDVPNMKAGKMDYTFNVVDGQYFVDAVKALSDSSYSGLDLADRLYVHAYTQPVFTNNSITGDALEDLLTGENTALLDMVVSGLFGGKNMPATIAGVKGTAGAVTEKDLLNGDILLVDGKVYGYGDGLWSLAAGAVRVDTAEILAALPQAEKYAVLRPSCALAGIVTPTDPNAPLDELNDYQKAIIATAEAYLLRGEKLQYSDTRFTAQGSTLGTEFRWQSKVNAPEDCTSTEWGYTNCAAFAYEVYYQGLGFPLPDDMYTTKKLVANAPNNGTLVYLYEREVDSQQTDAEKAQVQQAFMSKLQPGDILVILRNNSSGHAMLYVGDGNIIHSGGNVYNYTAYVGTEVYEASIRRMKVLDYFFNPASTKGYVFGQVSDLAIIRPLQIFDGQIPENTQNRVANMQGIMAQKLSSHTKSQTVNPGENITFTFEIYNTRSTPVTLDISDKRPENTTLVSGQLQQQVTIPAEGRVKVSYTVKVNADVPYGTVIQSTDSTVGGVTVKCAPVQVKRSFTAAEQAAMIEKVKQLRADGTNTLTGLALANEIYKAATGETLFASTDMEAVAEGTDGIFAKWKMSTETTKRQLYKVNTGSKYQKLVAPTLYGGYRMFTPLWQHDRTRLPQAHDLQVGDLLIGRTLSSRVMLLYLGQELGFVNLNKATLDADTVAIALRLERLHGYGYYFAILRPSFALETE